MVVKLTTLIFVLRCKKIFDSSESQNIFEYSNLTDEEKYVFFGNREREQRINIVLKMLLEGKSKTLEKNRIFNKSEFCNYKVLGFHGAICRR